MKITVLTIILIIVGKGYFDSVVNVSICNFLALLFLYFFPGGLTLGKNSEAYQKVHLLRSLNADFAKLKRIFCEASAI